MKKILNKYHLLSTFAKASLWFTFCSVLQKSISLLTMPIFTRIISTQEYGQYSVFNSWMEIATVFVTFKLTSGVFMQGMVKYEKDVQNYETSIKSLFSILILGWTILYLLFSSFFNNLTGLTTLQTLLMFVIIWSVGSYDFWSIKMRIKNKYQLIIIVTLIVNILIPIVSIVAVIIAEDKVLTRISCIAIISFIGYGSLYIFDAIKAKQIINFKYWKYALTFAIPLVPHYLSMSILNGSDRIMINHFVGSDAAGIYGLAYSLSMIMMIFNSSLMGTLEPTIYQAIKNQDFSKIGKTTYPMVILVAVVNVLLVAFAPEIIRIFAPTEYYAAIWIIPPVAMSVFILFLCPFFIAFELYFEKKNYILISTITATLLNLILNFIFIQKFGYIAAGYTTLFSYITYALMNYICFRKVCKDSLGNVEIFNLKILLFITCIFLGLGFILLLTYNFTYLRCLMILIIIAICLINRKKITSEFKNIIAIKKNKEFN